MYADDTHITYTGSDLHLLQSSLSHDLDKLSKWLVSNRLTLNATKFPSRRIDFTPKTYFVSPKTSYCQQQCQCPIFPSQARDQSFTRVPKCDKTREDIGRSGLCQS